MPYAPFDEYFRELAEAETRVITVLPAASDGLPPDTYAFRELYCNERGCDCRRVFFSVLSEGQKRTEAVIAYGWETKAFYAKWMGNADLATLVEMQGPILNVGSPQSSLAPAILRLTEEVLLKDSAYLERIKRHYALYRQKIEGGKLKWKAKDKSKGFGQK
jgi:hypothetical protein